MLVSISSFGTQHLLDVCVSFGVIKIDFMLTPHPAYPRRVGGGSVDNVIIAL